MDIETKALGRVSITENDKIHFPSGLFGFEDYKEFALINSEYEPFYWLQSLQEKNLAFLVVDPFVFCTDYEIDVDDESLLSIGIDTPEKVKVMTIITIPVTGSPVTANLQGPVIINKDTNTAKQVVLTDNRWSTKYKLIQEKESD